MVGKQTQQGQVGSACGRFWRMGRGATAGRQGAGKVALCENGLQTKGPVQRLQSAALVVKEQKGSVWAYARGLRSGSCRVFRG